MATTKKKSSKPTKEQKAKIKEEAERRQAEIARKKEIHDEITSVIIIAIGVFLAVSLHTHSTGQVGVVIQQVLMGLFGKVAYAFPYYLIVYGILNFAQKTSYISWRSVLFCSILFFLISTLFATAYPVLGKITWNQIKLIYQAGKLKGGVIGTVLVSFLSKYVGKIGIYIICGAGIIVCLLFVINTPISAVFDKMKIKAKARREATAEALAKLEEEGPKEEQVKLEEIKQEIDQKARLDAIRNIESTKVEEPEEDDLPKLNLFSKKEEAEAAFDELEEEAARYQASEPAVVYDTSDNKQNILSMVTDDNLFGRDDHVKTSGYGLDGDMPGKGKGLGLEGGSVHVDLDPQDPMGKNAIKAQMFPDENYNVHRQGAKYKFPPLSLLAKLKSGKEAVDLHSRAVALENTLKSFGVDATVSDVVQGPSVTRFEVTPAPGVKVSKITNLHDDIALNLRARSLRIEAPIPGKAAVGIEISNDNVNTVGIREIIDSREFSSAKSKISMGLGKSIAGTPVIANLKDMPHLLIAGSTGSGKSVCINSIIMSFLYKATPEEVKLILIDPKVVELSIYNGIPHLLIPVVTEPGKAAAALGWAVTEMDERYKKFSEENVRDIQSYNESVIADGEKDKVLPQIVIIIDELHDLMMAAQNQVETYIARLAAKARAAGIHLIIATQRPSVDVITGVIKANIPSRIAFAVSSQIDSRTILDMGGAEHLIGKGDMLYSPQGMDKPMRVQGCFVSDEEVSKVIEFVKKNSGVAEYSQTVNSALEKNGLGSGSKQEDEDDELFSEAVEFIVHSETASVSSLQRRFRIGYNRAARLIDDMEARGIVGPADGSHPRKVLMTPADFDAAQKKMNDREVDF